MPSYVNLATLFCFVASCFLPWLAGIARASDPRILSVDGSSRATGYAEANKIITFDGKTHVSWLDSTTQDGFEVKIRTLDHATSQWSPTYTIGEAEDNHGGPALTIDSEGYLHVAYYPHHEPMRYRRSQQPNDTSSWTPVTHIADNLTYPTMVTGPDNTLYLTARNSTGSSWSNDLFTLSPGGSWSSAKPLIEASDTSYFHFQDALAWGPDHQTLHMSVRMYGEDPRWGYKIGYLQSTDFGDTWQHYDGTPVTLPAFESTLDTVEATPPSQRAQYENSSSLRGGSIAVDNNNVPYILYNTLQDDGSLPRQAWIATPDGAGGWSKTLLNDKIDILPDNGWGLGTPGGLTITPDGRMTMVLTMADDSSQGSFWGTTSSEVVWVESNDGGQTFTSQIISNVDPSTPNWLPSIERPTGFNELTTADPAVVYTSGERGSSNTAIVSNEVIFWAEGGNFGWNGVLGDVNQDGFFTGNGHGTPDRDDVSAFIDAWGSGELPGVFGTRASYMRGDLNFDGKTDIWDAVLMRSYLIDNSMPTERLAVLFSPVPEPSAFPVVLIGLGTLAGSMGRTRWCHTDE
ncbi:BNR-4 repeat-containing protein [Aeoliella sp.]|uniref:BNR-4 repeat-containing protein n=1 Tax=Aeoliella sp. TaxID=2795800 RepID=UPI003CCBC9F4